MYKCPPFHDMMVILSGDLKAGAPTHPHENTGDSWLVPERLAGRFSSMKSQILLLGGIRGQDLGLMEEAAGKA